MTTGQAPIIFKNESNLDTSDTLSNVATNQADLAAQSNVDGLDIYPRTVTCGHLFAADGSFSGHLNAGTIYVGSGGVTISSAANGATPATGLFLSSSQLIMYKSSVATFTLNGTTGEFTIQTAASGARLILDANGIEAYNGSAVKTFDLNSADGTFTLQTAASGARLVLNGDGIEAYNSSSVKTVDINSADGTFTLQSAASGERVEITNAGIKVYDSSGDVRTLLTSTGLDIRNGSADAPVDKERLSLCHSDGTEVAQLFGYYTATLGDNNFFTLQCVPLDAARPVYISGSSSLTGAGASTETLTLRCGGSPGYAGIDMQDVEATGSDLYIAADRIYMNTLPLQTAWTSYAGELSILTCEATFTLSSITYNRAAYCVIGPLCFFEVKVTFTTADCGAGDNDLYIKVPDAYTIANSFHEGYGSFIPAGGVRTQGFTSYQDTTHILFRKRDAADWVDGAANVINVSGFFTWAAA